MITKRLFIETLSKIQDDALNADKLDTFFYSMKNDFIYGTAFINPILTDLTIEVLDACFENNREHWVSYWVYELEFGSNAEDMPIRTADNNLIVLKTIEDLWDWLITLE